MSPDPSPTPTKATLRQRETRIFHRGRRRSRRLVHTDFVTIGPAAARSSLETEAVFRARAFARTGVFIAVFVALFSIGAGWALKMNQLNPGAVENALANTTASPTADVVFDEDGGQAVSGEAGADADAEGYVDDGETPPASHLTQTDDALSSPPTVDGDGALPSVSSEAESVIAFGTLPPSRAAAGDDQPMLAIVIDDWGYGWNSAPDFLAFDEPLTVAVLPYLPFTQSHAEAAARAGHQVILHLPMEPLGAQWDTSDHMITTSLAGDRIADEVRRALGDIPFVTGVNNHMGSKATADRRVVTEVLKEVQAQGLVMLDSRTTVNSVVADMAREMGVPYAVNNIFLDSEPDAALVAERLVTAAKSARRFGKAVTIGHVQPETYKGIMEALPLVEAEGVRLAYLWEVLSGTDAPAGDAPIDDLPVAEASGEAADSPGSLDDEAVLNDADAVE